MAEEVGKIFYTLDLDSKQFERGVAEASGSMQALGASFEKASKVAAIAVAAMGTAVAVGLFKAAKASWDQVDAVQQATVALKAYEPNAQAVNAVLKDLISYARSDLGVLFNRKDLFESAQSLKLMGDNTGDLVEHVKILSRSVGLGLSNWEDLNRVVGRVGSTGRLAGEDFDNLTKAGYKLDPALRNTSISWHDLFVQLDKGIPVNALEGQANTVKGLGIRMQTAFRGIGDAILGVDSETSQFVKGGLGDKLTNAMAGATAVLKSLKQPLAEFSKYFADAFSKVIDVIVHSKPILIGLATGAITLLILGFVGLGVAIWSAFAPIIIIEAAVVALGIAFGFIVEKLGGFKKIWRIGRAHV